MIIIKFILEHIIEISFSVIIITISLFIVYNKYIYRRNLKQKSGKNSNNFQSGGDMNINL